MNCISIYVKMVHHILPIRDLFLIVMNEVLTIFRNILLQKNIKNS